MTLIPNYNAGLEETSLVIASGQSLSAGSADVTGYTPVGLWTPSAWTAAAITFLASRDDGANFADVFDATLGEVTIPSALIPTGAARRFTLDPRQFLGVRRLQIRSGTTGSGNVVPQAADRTLYLILRPLS